MNTAMLRSNLLISKQVEVTDPNGAVWTVVLVRPNEPRSPFIRYSSWYWWAALFGWLSRVLRHDKGWNVEVLPGDSQTDRRKADVRAIAASRESATAFAIEIAEEIQRGGT